MSKFYINGEIVSKEFEKYNLEDVCPKDVQDFIAGLDEGEDIELYFSSLGGDVLAGLQIVSLLADAQKNGHKTIANVTSIAASMASVIACACQELNLYEGAFLMCHLPWGVVVGNSKDLQKEIATLDQIKNSMVKIYKTKFDLTDEELEQMLEAETWIDCDNYKDYKLSCSIVSGGEPLKLAASISDKHYSFVKNFKNTPKRILDMENISNTTDNTQHNEDTTTSPETTAQDMVVQDEVIDEKKDETPEEQTPADDSEKSETPEEEEKPEEKEPTIEELKEALEKANERIAELEKSNEDLKKQLAECGGGDEEKEENAETITKAECERRVSGMQSTMQAKVNDLNAKMNEFQNQLMAKNEELTQAKAEITSLKDSLHNTSEELSRMASAYEEKNKALERLNSGVNAHAEELPTFEEGLAKCASARERVAFVKSGKYRK